MRDSIVKLCEVDHHGDQATLSAWLANKTDAQFGEWIASSRHAASVVDVNGVMAGFGLLNCSGTVGLLYVDAAAASRGATPCASASRHRTWDFRSTS